MPLTFEQLKLAVKLGLTEAEKHPRIVGGTQPIFCAGCKKEIGPNDDSILDLQNRRLHSACQRR
jgi:hypothetical protein